MAASTAVTVWIQPPTPFDLSDRCRRSESANEHVPLLGICVPGTAVVFSVGTPQDGRLPSIFSLHRLGLRVVKWRIE